MYSFLHILSGTWFIISTNFPMWLKPDNHNPSFTYTITEKKGYNILLDEVKYLKKNKPKVITGYDYPDKKNAKGFTWKGKGIFFFAKSTWEVKLMDDTEQWAVIYFSKTLFTSEGVDIISHSTTLDNTILNNIKTQMLADSVLKKHVTSLQVLPRTD